MKDYEINSSTLAIVPIDDNNSKVYEEEEEYVVNKSSNSIIKENCIFYGSSYLGRCVSTKNLTGIKSKYPIIIDESRNIIFFPTNSSRTQQSSWICLNKVEKCEKKNKHSAILFNNHNKIKFNISFYSLENQISRATLLKAKLLERKLKEKE